MNNRVMISEYTYEMQDINCLANICPLDIFVNTGLGPANLKHYLIPYEPAWAYLEARLQVCLTSEMGQVAS